MQTPTSISRPFGVQQEIKPSTALTAGYVGSHVICPASPCPATYPSDFPAPLAGSAIPAGTYYVPTSTRANDAIANTWTYFSEGDSSYNALQVDGNLRFSSGFTVRGVYTFAKTIDDGDSLNATTSGVEPALASNPFDLQADRGLANFDVRNVAVIDASWAVPLGAKKLYRGWTLNSIVTMQGGFPFTPQLSYNPSNNGDSRNLVRLFVNPSFSGPVILGSPNQWFNPAAFLAPPNARFNLLNRVNFHTPNAVVFTPSGVSPTAGLITSTSTMSRQVQFGLKLLW